MEIHITTNQTLKVLQVISWIIYIGLCIDAGGILVNTGITIFFNPDGVKNFWEGSGYLSSLYDFDPGHFVAIAIIMIIVAVLKSLMFYQIVKMFSEKKLDLSKPFNIEIKRIISNLAFFALGIGLFAYFGLKYSLWLTGKGLQAPNLEALHISGADVWLFMAVILFVIAQIVKKGIEIQLENDLTI